MKNLIQKSLLGGSHFKFHSPKGCSVPLNFFAKSIQSARWKWVRGDISDVLFLFHCFWLKAQSDLCAQGGFYKAIEGRVGESKPSLGTFSMNSTCQLASRLGRLKASLQQSLSSYTLAVEGSGRHVPLACMWGLIHSSIEQIFVECWLVPNLVQVLRMERWRKMGSDFCGHWLGLRLI